MAVFLYADSSETGTPQSFATIQAAIDAAQDGNLITIESGTYAAFTVGKDVTVVGLGNPGDVVIAGTFRSDNAIADGTSVPEYLKTAPGYSTASGAGITVTGNGVTLQNLLVSSFATGIDLGSSDGLTLTGVSIDETVNGIAKATSAVVTHFTMTGGTISDTYIGLNIAAANGAGAFDQVTIDGTHFEHLGEKGIYAEQLSNARIVNIAMTDVGEFGRGPAFGPAATVGEYGAGIDINLKYGNYANIEIADFTFSHVGTSAGVDAVALDYGAAIVVKARNDGANYGANPATATGVTIHDGTIDYTSTGIRVGEPGTTVSGADVTVSDVTVTHETVADFQNTSTANVTFPTGQDLGTNNDTYAEQAGDQIVNGAAGEDTAVYTGTLDASDFSYNAATNAWTVTSQNGGTDQLIHFEKVKDAAGHTFLLVDLQGSYTTIQAAVNAAGTGDTLLIAPGTYVENVTIAKSDLTLLSTGGRAVTTIQGVQAGSELGAVQLTPGANNVTIGGANAGFTIQGINGNGAIEKAAIYLQGTHTNIDIVGNDVVANGDLGLVSEYNQGVVDILIDGNIFSGKTFTGTTVDGFPTNQFADGNNVPRQLVAIGGGNAGPSNPSSNVQFVNNIVSGTAGAETATAGTFRGNQLVTIDANDSIARNNDFTGDTVGDNYALRVRGTSTDVIDNDLTGHSAGIFVNNQGDPGVYSGNDITGTGDNDAILGTPGADTINGGTGNDTIAGNGGADAIDGGDGTDTVAFAGPVSNYVVVGGDIDGDGFIDRFDSVIAASGTTTLTDVERLSFNNGATVLNAADPIQVYDASGNPVGTYTTIQAAVNAAPDGSTVLVKAGTYTENVVIARSNITLLSVEGRDATIIQGVQAGGELGAITLAPGANNVTIGSAGFGFTIQGINGNGAIEKAAIYLQGTHTNIDIVGNNVVANGDLGLVSEYNQGVVDILIDGNIFSGKTFTGTTVDGFPTNQFADGNNVPRQLVAIGGGNAGPSNPSSNVQFVNNTVSGTAGAETATAGTFRGNQLVTIDANDSVARNNDFTGNTVGDNYALRVRGTSTDVIDNDLTGHSAGILVQNQGDPGTYSGNSLVGTGDDDVITAFTPGSDTLSGAGGDDVLTGGTGNDRLDGGTGTDTAAFSGPASGYTITSVDTNSDGFADGFASVTGPDGTDTLIDIERLAFNNGATVFSLADKVQVFSQAGTLVGTYNSIQAAVNAAPVNGTVRVSAGDYAENVVITTAGVTLEGAPGRATTIRPGTSDAENGSVITVLADNVTIKGLTLDGANAALSGGVTMGGVVSHAASLISNFRLSSGGGTAIDGLQVLDNDLSHGQRFGVFNVNQNGFAPTGPSGGNLIQGNDFHDIAGISAQGALRSAVLTALEAYTSVIDNDFVDVGYGIQTNSLGVGDPTKPTGTDVVISGNDIAAQIGIFINNHYAASSATEVSGNTLTLGASAVAASSVGIQVWSVFNGATIDLSDNDATGLAYGYRLANNPGSVRIDGGTLAGNGIGVEVYDNYGFGNVAGENVVVLAGVSITGSTVANLHVADSDGIAVPLTIAFDAADLPTLGTAPVDVQLDGDTAGFDANGYAGALKIVGNGADNELGGGAGNDTLTGNAGSDTGLFQGNAADATIAGTTDATGRVTSFTSVTTSAGGTDTLSSIEKLSFANGAVVLDSTDPVQLFNTAGKLIGTFDTIQSAIDAASTGFTVRVAAGTYTENVNFNKAVTVLGAHAGDDGATAGRGAASAGETNLIGRHDITAAGAVHLDGLRFVNTSATTNGGPSDPILQIVTGGDGAGHVVENSVFYSEVNGALRASPDDRAISTPVIGDGHITIADNYFTGAFASGFGGGSWGRAVWFDGGGVDLDVTGNKIEYSRTGLNLDMSGTSQVSVSDNLFTTTGTAVAVGVDTDGLTITDNDFVNAGEEFNFRNETVNVTFDAETAVDTQNGAYIDVLGGDGNDHLSGTSFADLLDGNQLHIANADNDLLEGRAGNDVLIGRAGNDTLNGGAGDDIIAGGDGTDTLILSGGWADYTISGSAGSYTIADKTAGRDGTDTVSGIELVSFNGTVVDAALIVDDAPIAANDTNASDPVKEDMDASATGNVLTNDTNSDVTLGDALRVNGARIGGEVGSYDAVTGATMLSGTYGTLTINPNGSYSYALDNSRAATQALANGATGTETFSYRVADNGGQTDTATLTISVAGTNDAPLLTGITGSPVNLTESNDGANTNFAAQTGTLTVNDVDTGDSVTGHILSVTSALTGGGTLTTAQVNSLTTGEGGGPALTFGSVTPNGTATALNWTYDPGAALVNQLSEEQTVTITYTVEVRDALTGSASTQQIVINIAGTNETQTGTPDDDVINGTALADDLYGLDGDDAISGASGDDDIYGGTGDDSVLAGAGNDLVYGGDGDDSIDGGSDNDTLYGGDGTDSINGGSGNDIIYAGSGDDAINGGSGSDTLVLDGAWTDYTITKAGSTYVFEGNGQEVTASAVEGFTFTGNTGNDGPFTAAQILNDGPTAVNDTATATGGTVSGLNVLTNDTDLDIPLGDFLTVTGARTGVDSGNDPVTDVTGATQIIGKYGTLTINPNGSYSYAITPTDPDYLALAAGAQATDVFTYRAADAKGSSDLGRLTITVIGGNTAPTGPATGTLAAGTEDVVRVLTTAELTAGFTDANNDTLSVQNLTSDRGTITPNGNGTFNLTLPANDNGAVNLTYQVSDGHGGIANAARTVTFAPVDDAPIGADSTATVAEDAVLTFDVASLITEVDGQATTVTATATHGTVSVAGTVLTFTPTADFNGPAAITYTVRDASGAMLSDQGTIAVTVTPVNDAPVAVADSFSTAEDAPLNLTAAQLLANDQDVDGDTLTIVEVLTDPAGHGTVTRNLDGSITFTPDADYNGPATFTYVISDGTTTTTSSATVNVSVTAVNDAPTGSSTAVLANGTEDQTYYVSKASLLQGFSDVDGDTLSVTNFTATPSATVVEEANRFVITLAANQNGAVSLTYQVSDGTASVAGALSFTVDGVNDAPVGTADTLSATEDTVATFAATLLLGNDSDVEGQTLSIADVTSGTGGSVAIVNGDIVFTPDANFNGPATFTYRATDGTALSGQTTVTVNVTAVNDVATITGTRTGSVTEDGTLTTSGDLDISDVDTGEASFRSPASLAGAYGTFTFNIATGIWGYTLTNSAAAVQALNTGQTLHDTLQVTSFDGTATATLDVTINGQNEAVTGIMGTEAGETITGTAAAESIYGLGGDDILIGLAGGDRLDGGSGVDTASYAGSTNGVTVNLVANTGVSGDAQGDTFFSIENLIGSANADSLTGNDGDNVIDGAGGNDTLSGGGGNDMLIGGAGNDAMAGGLGNDLYIVDATGDVVTEAAGQGTDTVQTTLASYTLTANVETLIYTGNQSFVATGNASANTIVTGIGNDRLDGKAGADVMTGGLGNDLYIIDDAGDMAIELADEGTDSVQTTLTSYTLAANIEFLTMLNAANSTGTGNNLGNTIFGANGNDTLSGLGGIDRLVGGAGNDALIGGAGADALTGGAGDDRFVFASGDFGTISTPDGITDFSGNDVIDFSQIGGLTFIGTANFSAGGGGQVRYTTRPGFTDVILDLNGDGVQDALVRLSGSFAMDSGDFIL